MANITQRTRSIIGLVGVGGLLIAFPYFVGNYYLSLATMILLFGYLGAAWNILGGYAGQFSFGHAAFFGVGAFTSTLLHIHLGVNPWLGMLLAGMAGMLLGLIIGFVSFRFGLRGAYFALAMLAVAEMLRLLAVEWMAVRYPLGILIPIKEHSFTNFQFTSKIPYYYIILFMVAAVLYLTYSIEGRKVGSYFKAIRENEYAADASGINIFKYKLLAIAISSCLSAMGGTFYAQYYLTIDSDSAFGTAVSIQTLLGPILGGVGTVFGPPLGAGILEVLSELTRNYLGRYSGMHLMVYGAILIFIIIYLPKGILGGLKKVFGKRFWVGQ